MQLEKIIYIHTVIIITDKTPNRLVSATCLTYSTDYYQRLSLESWFTTLEQMPLNCSQLLPALQKQLIDRTKQNQLQENNMTTDNLNNNKRLCNCDNRLTKRTNKITSLHSQINALHGLIDKRPITSWLNWPIRSITRV